MKFFTIGIILLFSTLTHARIDYQNFYLYEYVKYSKSITKGVITSSKELSFKVNIFESYRGVDYKGKNLSYLYQSRYTSFMYNIGDTVIIFEEDENNLAGRSGPTPCYSDKDKQGWDHITLTHGVNRYNQELLEYILLHLKYFDKNSNKIEVIDQFLDGDDYSKYFASYIILLEGSPFDTTFRSSALKYYELTKHTLKNKSYKKTECNKYLLGIIQQNKILDAIPELYKLLQSENIYIIDNMLGIILNFPVSLEVNYNPSKKDIKKAQRKAQKYWKKILKKKGYKIK